MESDYVSAHQKISAVNSTHIHLSKVQLVSPKSTHLMA